MYDYLIVGSGLFGSVFAHEMHKKGFYNKCWGEEIFFPHPIFA